MSFSHGSFAVPKVSFKIVMDIKVGYSAKQGVDMEITHNAFADYRVGTAEICVVVEDKKVVDVQFLRYAHSFDRNVVVHRHKVMVVSRL